jgi:hypothetical protein
MRSVSLILLGGLLSAAAAASPPPTQAEFEAAAGYFSGCMVATVQMGMLTKMDPGTFKAGLDKSCKPEEARFRAAAVRQAMALGRPEAQAGEEVDGNIARGRAIWASNQETYVRTGKLPK